MKRQLLPRKGYVLIPVFAGLAILLSMVLPLRELRAGASAAQPAAVAGAQAAVVAAQAVTPTLAASEPATSTSPTGDSPAFLTIQPDVGFPLDPFLVSLQGGGPVEAGSVAKGCTGYIPANPTVSVDFKGKVGALKVFFYSQGDTTLVIQTPDGNYQCNDNTNPVILDPTLTMTNPVAGRYNVWVGAGAAQDLVPGFLVFTARADVGAGALALRDLIRPRIQPDTLPVRPRLLNAANRIERVLAAIQSAETLPADGVAVSKEITATGDLPAVELQTGDSLCGGLVNAMLDYVFDWAGETQALSLMVEASGDTTLLVREPDGSIQCADDADGTQNLNPLLTTPEPAEGRYLVWVGRVNPDEPVTGTLTIAAATELTPQVLQK